MSLDKVNNKDKDDEIELFKKKLDILTHKYSTKKFDKKTLGILVEIFVSFTNHKTKETDFLIIFDIMKNYADFDHIEDNIKNEICNIYFDVSTDKFLMEKILTNEFIYPHDEYKTDILIKREKQFEFLKTIPQFEQRSDEWFQQREGMITASDIGTAININHYQKRYSLILKKCDRGPPYKDNKYVHHGKKYEEVATMIYQFRYNVKVEEFGLIPHPFVPFVGASPDGICTKYTLDGKLSTLVGRMLEIKCPFSREIKLEGEIYDEICPAYYWAQVQVQLEVCDLDECDFWQCRLEEYKNREEFIEDTDPKNMYLSKEHGQEKGCIIQLLPKEKINEFCLFSAKYLYPPKINMTPKECDEWVFSNINNIWKIDIRYVFDKVIYWKLTRSKNVTIYRDVKWFNKVLPTIKETWDYISFYRKDEKKLDQYCEFVEKNKKKKNNNDIILDFAHHQYNNIPFDTDDLLSKDSPMFDVVYAGPQGNFVDTDNDSDDDMSNNKKKEYNKKKLHIFITNKELEKGVVKKEKKTKPKKSKSKIISDKKGSKFYKSSDDEPECMLLSDSYE